MDSLTLGIGHNWMTRVDEFVQKIYLIMHKSFDITFLNNKLCYVGPTVIFEPYIVIL